jgi:hypothetical protein
MKDPDKAIVCGACKVPVTCPSDPKPNDQIVCVRCGARDAFEQVWKVCLKHIQYRLQNARKRGTRFDLSSTAASASNRDGQEPFFKWRIKD